MVSVFLIFCMALSTALVPALAIAGPIPSSTGIRASQRQADVALIEEQLGRADVQRALADAGTDATELRARLPALSDHDVHQLASRIDDVKSGGLITEILVIVVLVLLILYLMKRI
ncbi:MAG: PA2779 family protein [bacterium]